MQCSSNIWNLLEIQMLEILWDDSNCEFECPSEMSYV